MARSWKGCKDWADIGLPMSTSSNEASKLYDAVLTQFVQWEDDPSTGGVLECSEKLLQADPNFIMGQALVHGYAGSSGLCRFPQEGTDDEEDVKFRNAINNMVELANKSTTCTQREKTHVEAVKMWTEGKIHDACATWEDILVEHPNDLLALKQLQLNNVYLGDGHQIRDTVARVIPLWKPDDPLYGHLLGMYAFGLEESGSYEKAEKMARKCLELKPRDGWGTHALGHVFEMTGRYEEGIQQMTTTVHNWSSSYVATHTFWHWALYYIETGDFQAALDLYDNEVFPRTEKSGSRFNISDSTSMLYRLTFEGVDVGDRWEKLFAKAGPLLTRHCHTYYDVLLHALCLGKKDNERAREMLNSLREFAKEPGDFHHVTKDVGIPICEAFTAYAEGRYDESVRLMFPRRYKIWQIGGSHAQRSVFDLFLVNAAIKSPVEKHQLLARQMLLQNLNVKGNSPLSERWMQRIVS